jgi:hypothetical protein
VDTKFMGKPSNFVAHENTSLGVIV